MQGRRRAAEKESHLPKVAQPSGGRAGIQTQAWCLQKLGFSQAPPLPFLARPGFLAVPQSLKLRRSEGWRTHHPLKTLSPAEWGWAGPGGGSLCCHIELTFRGCSCVGEGRTWRSLISNQALGQAGQAAVVALGSWALCSWAISSSPYACSCLQFTDDLQTPGHQHAPPLPPQPELKMTMNLSVAPSHNGGRGCSAASWSSLHPGRGLLEAQVQERGDGS